MSRSPARVEADVIYAATLFAEEVFEADRGGQSHSLAFACQAFSHSLLQKGYSDNEIELALRAAIRFPHDADERRRGEQIALSALAYRAVDRSLGGKIVEALIMLGALSAFLSFGVIAAAIATAIMGRKDAALLGIAAALFVAGLVVAFSADLLRRGLVRRALGRLGARDRTALT